MDEIFSRTDSTSTRDFLVDALGSTLALTDSSGAVQTQYTYEPFGKATAGGSSNSSTYQYTGRDNDGTGLYYYRARYYNPTLGRYLSEDPIGFDGDGTNFYAYVDNNPIILIDPSGLTHCVGGANCDFTPPMRDALQCFDSCTGRDNAVTSGRRPGGGQHGRGQACDLNRANNPSLSRPDVGRCVQQCFPNGYAQEEKNGPSYRPTNPNDPSTHWHLQLNTLPGGAPGLSERVQPYTPSPPK